VVIYSNLLLCTAQQIGQIFGYPRISQDMTHIHELTGERRLLE